jgi:hypothetical protein
VPSRRHGLGCRCCSVLSKPHVEDGCERTGLFRW